MQGARRIIAHQEVLMLRLWLTPMNLKRAATIVVIGGALAAWLAAAATSGRREITLPPLVQTRPDDTRGAELATQVARLHERLRPDSAPKRVRNLFEFVSPKPRSAPVTAPSALTEAPRAPVAPQPLKLVGVAENAGSNGTERTAIIAGLGQLFLVKEGENVTLRYRVTKISGDVVELADADDGTTLRLALK